MKRSHGGFTLVELLVTIAIVAVLAALTIFVARRGKAAAQAAHCVNNVRQLLNAQLMITQDTNGYLIHSGQTPVQGKKRNYAMHFTVLQHPDLSYTDPGVDIQPHVTSVEWLSCPTAYAAHKAEMSKKTGAGRWRTYALNNRIGLDPDQYRGSDSQGAAHDGAMRPEQVESPQLLMMVAERQWNGNNYPSAFGPHSCADNPMPGFHNGGFHVGFMDGHVERMTYTEFPYQGNTMPDGRTVEFKGKPKTPNEIHWSLVWRGMAHRREMPSAPQP
jgi:prepilin-type N-terminal cleavage/methylation domain-containing protein/prepilin-type processing-associated H-X9-DG protein